MDVSSGSFATGVAPRLRRRQPAPPDSAKRGPYTKRATDWGFVIRIAGTPIWLSGSELWRIQTHDLSLSSSDRNVLLASDAELESLDAARVEASRRAGALLLEHAGQLWVDEDWRMDVTDETGLILFVIQISAMRSAATKAPAPISD